MSKKEIIDKEKEAEKEQSADGFAEQEKAKESPKIHVFSLVRYFARLAAKCSPTYFLVYILDILVYAAAPFVNIIFPARIIDELLTGKRMSYIALYTGLTIGINALCNCLKNILDITKEKYADLFEKYVAMLLAEKCIDMDFQHTEDKKVLEQLEKAKTGMDWYSGGIAGIMNTFGGVLTDFVTLLGVAAILVFGMPWLIVVYVVSVVVDMLLTRKLNQNDLKSFRNLSKVNQIFGYVFWELQDIRFGKDIRLYGAEPLMEEKGEYYNNQMTQEWRRQALANFPYNEGSTVLSVARTAVTVLVIGAKALKKVISIGDFTMYFNAGNTLHSSMWGIIWSVQQLYKQLCYANEFIVFMEYPNAVRHGDKLPQEGREHTIEFRNVSFAYPGSNVQVLKNINIVLHPGEHISIVGLNGAGKTTFIKLLCRLYDPTEGEILLDGVDIRDIVYEEYVKLLAVVFQDFQLFSFTARENVTLTESHAKAEDERQNEEKLAKDFAGREIFSWNESEAAPSDERFEKVIAQAGLTDTIAGLKYGADTYIQKSFDNEGCELSGGQQQKLAIARALYKDAPVVILDEPTAALDPIAEYEIYRQFNTLVGGRTAIYISHRLSSCQFCDIIYVFVDGEIRERGTHEQLAGLAGGHYAKMFEAQAQYYR